MKWSEIPLLDYIMLSEEQCDVYVHTKDKRIIVVKDVRTNGHLDDNGFYVDHNSFGLRFSFFLPREDFSHIEYRYTPRKKTTKEDFDELHSFVEEQFAPNNTPAESLTEPDEWLYEDLI